MEYITTLARPIYQMLFDEYPKMNDRINATKRFILENITQWTIKKRIDDNGNYIFKPKEFEGLEGSDSFEVILLKNGNTKDYQLKFGNFKESDPKKMYAKKDSDSHKLRKALFLINVLQKEVVKLFYDNEIETIYFDPYSEDGLGSDRLAYFKNMFNKLNKDDDFELTKMHDIYSINKK